MSVWTSAGAEARSVSELGMMNLEQMRSVRSSNTAATMRSKEVDALAGESDDAFFQSVTTEYQKEAAEWAKIGAIAAAATAIVGAGVSLGSGIATIAKDSAKAMEIANAITKAVTGLLGVVGPIMNLLATIDEVEALTKQSKLFEVKADDAARRAAALDANPAQ